MRNKINSALRKNVGLVKALALPPWLHSAPSLPKGRIQPSITRHLQTWLETRKDDIFSFFSLFVLECSLCSTTIFLKELCMSCSADLMYFFFWGEGWCIAQEMGKGTWILPYLQFLETVPFEWFSLPSPTLVCLHWSSKIGILFVVYYYCPLLE